MLEIDGLRKNYRDFSLDCSMKVESGRITGLVGQNGAGKSTTFKAVLGLISYDDGRIRLFGKKPSELTRKDKEKMGVVLNDSGFSGYLTVRDVVSILERMYDTFDRNFFLEQAGKFQLPLNRQIREFSTGMRAKLKVLAAISSDVKLLLLDEPTAGLDVVARDGLLEMLQDFMERDEERAILISSHISSDLETLCDDLYMVHQGKVVLHEDTDVLLSDYGILKVDEQQFQKLDREHLLRYKKEGYGYSCLQLPSYFKSL